MFQFSLCCQDLEALSFRFSCATPKAIVVHFVSMSRSSQKVLAKGLTMP